MAEDDHYGHVCLGVELAGAELGDLAVEGAQGQVPVHPHLKLQTLDMDSNVVFSSSYDRP